MLFIWGKYEFGRILICWRVCNYSSFPFPKLSHLINSKNVTKIMDMFWGVERATEGQVVVQNQNGIFLSSSGTLPVNDAFPTTSIRYFCTLLRPDKILKDLPTLRHR